MSEEHHVNIVTLFEIPFVSTGLKGQARVPFGFKSGLDTGTTEDPPRGSIAAQGHSKH